jgi:glutathione synthase/RimK-type ligase-like ATP-grasp enzyme
MHIGVVHTVGSPCGCAEAVAVGLKALGHEVTIANSEDIEFRASELAGSCDLVIDHTDTFRGRGLFRAFVRLMLEGYGARLVGSGSQACFTADDKIASKACLVNAGITTPPGIVVSSKQWMPPPWLRFPLVLKPAFEHMSRGVAVAETIREARSIMADMLNKFQQPIIAESYISPENRHVPKATESLVLASPCEAASPDRKNFSCVLLRQHCFVLMTGLCQFQERGFDHQ